ncbi:MAG: rod shape-determining protein RodA [Bacteroidales bacterium]|nr:rod shape-determining protein RodA [Bacteroidales bacterium]
MPRPSKNIFQNTDRTLIWLYAILVIAGWFNIYAAVYDEKHSSIFDIDVNYGKQLIWIVTSSVLIFVIMMTDPKFFQTFSYPIYGLVMIALVAVIFMGREISGSKSWFQIGGFSLQPAEFAKLATSLVVATYLGNIKRNLERFSTKVIVILLILVPCVIILAQNETGSALVFGAFVLVLFREGLSGVILILGLVAIILFILTLLFHKFIVIALIATLLVVIYYYFRKKKPKIFLFIALFTVTSGFVYSVDYAFEKVLQPHQKTRINVLLGKETDLRGAGYNVHQSLIAIGSGGFWGKGYLNGTQTKYNYVPEQSTDFIFCTVGEEWGFIGSLLVIGAYIFLLIRIIQLAERQRSAFSRIYGYSVASIMFVHFMINIGMTIGLMPVIGIPLPFFSYGGSSLWGFTLLLFVFIKLDSLRHDLI